MHNCRVAFSLFIIFITVVTRASICIERFENALLFNSKIDAFLLSDPKKVNSNIFEAFSNNPISYVDISGKVPESATQILTRTFGFQRQLNYQLFDIANQNLNFLGRVNGREISFYQAMNERIENTVVEQMQSIVPPGNGFPEFAGEVYGAGLRRNYPIAERNYSVSIENGEFVGRLQSNYRTLYEREVPEYEPRIQPARLIRLQTMEQHIESTGMGRRIYEQEQRSWNRIVRNFGPMYEPSRLGMDAVDQGLGYLTAEEWATLYNSPNYILNVRLSAFINHEDLRRNLLPNTMNRDTQMVYRNYRQRFVTIRGIHNTTIRVPFKRLCLD